MSFLAIELPRNLEEEKIDLESWMQILFNDDSKLAFFVNATRREDARRLAFDEIYKDISLKEAIRIAQHEIRVLGMEDNSEYILHNYGMDNGQIILNVIDDMRLRSEYSTQSEETTKIYERLYELSIETIKELCLENSSFRIGLIEVKKNLGKKNNRNEEEQEEFNPFCD